MVITTTLTATLLLVAGCDRSDSGTAPTPAASPAASAGGGAASPAAPAAAEPATPAAAPAPPAAPKGPRHEAPKHAEKAFRVSLSATFSGMPAGARLMAPSARDRRWQKVTKSEHQKVLGSVMLAEADENLLFLGDALAADAGGAGAYSAIFELVRRVASQGSLAAAKGLDWGEGQGKVGAAPTDAAVTAAAAQLAGKDAKPYGRLRAVLGRVAGLALAPEGADDPAQVLGGAAASPLGVAATTAALARAAGLPARVVQGLLLEGASKGKPHAWLEVELPKLGWVPLDPAMNRGKEGDAYLGTLPPDRVAWLYGSEAALPEDGATPRIAVTGRMWAPFGWHDGKRVGEVSWKAAVEEIALPAK